MSEIRQAVAKVLRKVEINPGSSNQHEFNGDSALKRFFGYETVSMDACLYFINPAGRIVNGCVGLTWYDARRASADRTGRSEFRLYYSAGQEDIMQLASEGDTLVITEDEHGTVRLIIVAQGVSFLDVLGTVLDGSLSNREYHSVTDLSQMNRLFAMLGR